MPSIFDIRNGAYEKGKPEPQLPKINMTVSNCCGAWIVPETDFCSACKEHCEGVEES